MSGTDQLLLIVLALHLYESALLVPRGAIVFTSWLGRAFRARSAEELFGNEQLRLALAPLLPPLGTVHVVVPMPFELAPEGIVVAGSPGPTLLRFDALPALHVERFELFAGERRLGRFDTAARAIEEQRWLAALAQRPAPERERAIVERIESSLDVAAIRRDAGELRRTTLGLRLLANALFLFFFAALPWSAWRIGLASTWPWLLAALAVLIAATAFAFVRAHGRIFPQRPGERRRHALALALAPLEAVRVVDAVARARFDDRHPVAVALALARPAQARAFARRELLALRHPLEPEDDARTTPAAATAAHRWCERTIGAAMAAAVQRCGIDLAELLAPPPRRSRDTAAYCPRCSAQYVAGSRGCADCRGVALVPFPAPDGGGQPAVAESAAPSPLRTS